MKVSAVTCITCLRCMYFKCSMHVIQVYELHVQYTKNPTHALDIITHVIYMWYIPLC